MVIHYVKYDHDRGGTTRFKLLSGYHCGLYPAFDHAKIKTDKNHAAFCGCPSRSKDTRPTNIVVDGKKYRLWTCPEHYIPQSIIDWFSQYKFYKDFPNCKMPDFEDISNKWINCARMYEQFMKETKEEIEREYVVDKD